jgi:hypothetical protein
MQSKTFVLALAALCVLVSFGCHRQQFSAADEECAKAGKNMDLAKGEIILFVPYEWSDQQVLFFLESNGLTETGWSKEMHEAWLRNNVSKSRYTGMLTVNVEVGKENEWACRINRIAREQNISGLYGTVNLQMSGD